MALTKSNPTNARDTTGVPGDMKYVIKTITFDSSYPTGGESLTPADAGFDSFHVVTAHQKSGYTFEMDYTNNKLLAYYYDYNGSADAAAIQVANAVDLSGVTSHKVFIVGS